MAPSLYLNLYVWNQSCWENVDLAAKMSQYSSKVSKNKANPLICLLLYEFNTHSGNGVNIYCMYVGIIGLFYHLTLNMLLFRNGFASHYYYLLERNVPDKMKTVVTM